MSFKLQAGIAQRNPIAAEFVAPVKEEEELNLIIQGPSHSGFQS